MRRWGWGPWPVSEQLLAALFAAGRWEPSQIHVVSVTSPRLTGGGKLTIMQRDILCVFCLFRGILPIERNVQHGERIQNESGPL